LVSDMCPLRHHVATLGETATILAGEGVPTYQVDAHNIVPVWTAADKRQVGARTLRPRINKVLQKFMTFYPKLDETLGETAKLTEGCVDWEACLRHCSPDTTVESVSWMIPGDAEAKRQLQSFIDSRLGHYDGSRNDPNQNVQSGMSPWVNYGHISFQRVALTVRALKKNGTDVAAFLEEGIVRRELSDNFCWYEPDGYDSLAGAAGWARDSLELHREDPREHIYTKEQFASAQTHDDLWNAAQIQLVETGRMHGFLRMYWAKKVLEWTPDAETALKIGLYLNDRFALDGNDPNGYVGVGWSIMGIHDMGWKERPIFGKIRFMNYAGCKRKFKVDNFVAKYPRLGVVNSKKKDTLTDFVNKRKILSSTSSSGQNRVRPTSSATSRLSKKMKKSNK